jgi:trk system potassium uptake protein TrkH
MQWFFAVGHIVGALTFCVGLSMILPLAFSAYYQDAGLLPLVESMLATLGFGALLYLAFKPTNGATTLNHRQGMAITALGWAAAGIFGALPFLLSGTVPTAPA